MNTERSPAYRLLELIWKHTCGATGHSWDRINRAMGDAVDLAIRAGLRFDPDDFGTFYERFAGHHWFGRDGADMLGEGFYSLALILDNRSAALSFEAWKDRPPFIVDRIEGHIGWCGEGHFHAHRTGRLALGYQFWWEGELVTVTSFAADGRSIIACVYMPRPAGGGATHKITRRFRITIDDLRAKMRARRKASKANDTEATATA